MVTRSNRATNWQNTLDVRIDKQRNNQTKPPVSNYLPTKLIGMTPVPIIFESKVGHPDNKRSPSVVDLDTLKQFSIQVAEAFGGSATPLIDITKTLSNPGYTTIPVKVVTFNIPEENKADFIESMTGRVIRVDDDRHLDGFPVLGTVDGPYDANSNKALKMTPL